MGTAQVVPGMVGAVRGWGGGRPGSLRTSWQGGLIDNSILRKLWNGKGYKDCISYTNYPPNGNIYKTLLTFT